MALEMALHKDLPGTEQLRGRWIAWAVPKSIESLFDTKPTLCRMPLRQSHACSARMNGVQSGGKESGTTDLEGPGTQPKPRPVSLLQDCVRLKSHLQRVLRSYRGEQVALDERIDTESTTETWTTVREETLALIQEALQLLEIAGSSFPVGLCRCVWDVLIQCEEQDVKELLVRLVPCLTPLFSSLDRCNVKALTGSSAVLTETLFGEPEIVSFEDMEGMPDHNTSPLYACLMSGCLWPLSVLSDIGSPLWSVFFHVTKTETKYAPLVHAAMQQGLLKEYCAVCPMALLTALASNAVCLSDFPAALIPWVWEFVLTSCGSNLNVKEGAISHIMLWAGTDDNEREVKDALFTEILSSVPPELEPELETVLANASLLVLGCAITQRMRRSVEALLPRSWVARMLESCEHTLFVVTAAFDAEMIDIVETILEFIGPAKALLSKDTSGARPIDSYLGIPSMESWAMEILSGRNARLPIGEKDRLALVENAEQVSRFMASLARSGDVTGLRNFFDICDAFSVPITPDILVFWSKLTEEVLEVLLKRVPHQLYSFHGHRSVVRRAFSTGQTATVISILKTVPDPYGEVPDNNLINDFASIGRGVMRGQLNSSWEDVLACFEACPSEVTKVATDFGNTTLLHLAAAHFPLEGIRAARLMVPPSMTTAETAGFNTPLDLALVHSSYISEEDHEVVRHILAPSSMAKRAN